MTTPPSPAGTFVPPDLLAGRLPQASPEVQLALLRHHLLRLSAAEARLDLDLGAALSRVTMLEVHQLGHAAREDFAREQLGFSWSHARELIALERKLRSLPVLRAAFLAGDLRRARVREVLRIARPESQSVWLRLGRSLTFASLAEHVAEAREAAGLGEAPLPPATPDCVRIAVTPEQSAYLECVALPMLRSVVGMPGPRWQLMGALAAEVLSEAPAAEKEEQATPRRLPGWKRRRFAQATPDEPAKLRELLEASGAQPSVAWPSPQGESLVARVEFLRELERLRRSLDAQRAPLLGLVRVRGLWRAAGHESFGQWVDAALGLSPKEVAAWERLAHDLPAVPALERAWTQGEITTPQGAALCRVVAPPTAETWLAFVRQATPKRVEVEIAAHVTLRVGLQDEGWLAETGGVPMRDALMSELRVKWADVIERRGERNASGSCNPGGTEGAAPVRLPRRRRPVRGAVPRWFSFDAPPGAASEFRRALKHVIAQAGGRLDAAGALLQMVHHFEDVHVLPALKRKSLRDDVLRRDGWTCTLPHCGRTRNLQVHHVVYRSRGGTNDRENLIAICEHCHRMEHEGKHHLMYEDVQLTAGGPRRRVLTVRTGRAYVSRARRIYREGLRWSVTIDPAAFVAPGVERRA